MTTESLPFRNISQSVRRQQFAIDTPMGDRIRVGLTQAENSEGTPLLIAPGWSNGIDSMASLATLIATQSNIPVVTLDHSRTRSNYDPEERKRDSLKAAITHSLKWLDRPGDGFDMLPYSEGAINGLMLAEQDERVQAFTTYAPAGIAERSYWQVTSGAAGEIIRLLHPRQLEHRLHLGKQATASLRYVAANPLLALKESHAAATTRTTDRLGLLAENIPVGISAGTHDGFFPAASVRASSPKNVPFHEISGNHTDLLYRQHVQQEVWGFHNRHSAPPAPPMAA